MPWVFLKDQMGFLTMVLSIWFLIENKSKNCLNLKEMKKLFSFKQAEAIKALYGIVISFGLYAIYSLMTYFGFIDLLNLNTPYPRGILAYALVTPYMAIGSLLAVVIAYHERSFRLKFVFSLISIVCLIGLFINNGRTAQLAFLITIIIFAIYNVKHILSWRYFIAILVVGASFYIAHSFGKLERFKNGVHEVRSAIESKEFAGSGGYRVYAWHASYDIIKRHPVFGVGVGDNIDEFKLFAKKHPGGGDWLRSLHNQHLDTLTRYGVVGYVLLWGSVLWLLAYLKKNRRFFPLALIFFSITFFDGLGDIILLMKPYNNIFIVMFMLFSIIVYKEEKQKES